MQLLLLRLLKYSNHQRSSCQLNCRLLPPLYFPDGLLMWRGNLRGRTIPPRLTLRRFWSNEKSLAVNGYREGEGSKWIPHDTKCRSSLSAGAATLATVAAGLLVEALRSAVKAVSAEMLDSVATVLLGSAPDVKRKAKVWKYQS